MLTPNGYKLLVFIAEKPRTFDEISNRLGSNYLNNPVFLEVDKYLERCGKDTLRVGTAGHIEIEEYRDKRIYFWCKILATSATILGLVFAILKLFLVLH